MSNKASEIGMMSKVRLISNPDQVGLVCGVTDLGDITRYDVFINGETRTFYSGQIVLADAPKAENIITPDDLRRSITAYQINTPSP